MTEGEFKALILESLGRTRKTAGQHFKEHLSCPCGHCVDFSALAEEALDHISGPLAEFITSASGRECLSGSQAVACYIGEYVTAALSTPFAVRYKNGEISQESYGFDMKRVGMFWAEISSIALALAIPKSSSRRGDSNDMNIFSLDGARLEHLPKEVREAIESFIKRSKAAFDQKAKPKKK